MRLPARIQRFVEEKFPEDRLLRWLIVVFAFVLGPIIYILNWYFTAKIWWELLQ